MNQEETRALYERMATRRSARREGLLGVSWFDRFDHATLAADADLAARLDAVLSHALRGHRGAWDSALDLGCGTFFYSRLLSARFRRVVGVDASRSMLRAGRDAGAASPGLSPVRLVRADAARLPFAAGSFDCVLCLDSLHHAGSPGALFSEARRVLARDGAFIAVEPNMQNPGMFLAHLFPRPERAALLLDWPRRLRRLAGRFFEDVEISFFNLAISPGYAGAAGRIFPFKPRPGAPFCLRMVMTARGKK